MLEKYRVVLQNSPLFKDVEENSYSAVLRLLENRVRSYDKGETIIKYGDVITHAGIVIEGSVEGTFLNEGYNEISMSRFSKGMMFGEALACLETADSPMEVKALEKTTILFLKLSHLQKTRENAEFTEILHRNLVMILAMKNAFLNLKVRILSQKSLRDKLMMYISSLPKDRNGYHIVTMPLTAVASFLNANRSALSRELHRIEEEGLISMNGKNIKIIQ